MKIDLGGRRALVTGGTGKLGSAISRQLAASGASVMMNGQRPGAAVTEIVDAVAAEARDSAKVAYLAADLTRPD